MKKKFTEGKKKLLLNSRKREIPSLSEGSTCLPARINSKSDIIVPESPCSGSNEEADNSTELSLDKGISSFTSIHSSLRVDLTKKAKCMHKEIKNFLENYKASRSSQLPRANDVHLMPFLVTSTNDDPSSEYQIDELANFLCANYPRLQDFSSQDVSSLLHNTLQFIINYRQGEDQPQDHEVSESSRKDSLMIASTSSQASMTVPVDSSSTLQESSLSADISTFLYEMADDDAARRAEGRQCLIEEEEVTVQPETLLDHASVLLNPTVQNNAKQFFSKDAWTVVQNTLKILEERFVHTIQRKYDMNSKCSNGKGKALIGPQKGRIISRRKSKAKEKVKSSKKTRLLCEGDVSQEPTKQKRSFSHETKSDDRDRTEGKP